MKKIDESLPENDELTDEDINKEVYLPNSCPNEEFQVFDAPTDYKGYFHPSALATYGCVNCAWRGTYQCPYKFEGGKVKKRSHPVWKGLEFPENVKVDGICKYKKDYLILLAGDWKEKPSYDIWHSRLMKNKGVIQNGLDESEYMKARKELELFESHYDTKLAILKQDLIDAKDKDDRAFTKDVIMELGSKLQTLKSDVQTKRQNFIQTWNILEGFFEKQVDRETAKKIDMNVNKTNIPHEQILDIMRGDYKVKDAKFKDVIKDDKD